MYLSDYEHEQAYERGQQDYARGVPQKDHPYADPQQARAWDDGWLDAAALDPKSDVSLEDAGLQWPEL